MAHLQLESVRQQRLHHQLIVFPDFFERKFVLRFGLRVLLLRVNIVPL